ncbi:MAG: helix-turn-helix domain-containing protein [Labilithrix sp.]|nr:helix-turn-helix domain-containing protein [Labilithrix sp.]
MSKMADAARPGRRSRVPIPLSLEVVDGDVDAAVQIAPVRIGTDDANATEMLTYQQTSKFLNVPVGTLYDWVHRKVVPHVRLGPRLVRFPLSALVRWLEARSVAEKGRVSR